ncbi:acyl transferase/acyl hydrolase/lysophospholipase [Ilyonectria destructans]|nr:acyl transferase/acyl hydrolase/lysophospholipase [Ilyonectria destructans]
MEMEVEGRLRPPARGLRLLSCDGGGIRGLSSIIILDRLMRSINRQNPPKPCEVFDLIGGNSTGGLIAIMLGRLEMTVEECIDKYIEISEAAFLPRRSKINLLGRVRDRWNIRGRFSSAALEKEIIKLIDTRPDESGMESLMLKRGTSCRSFVVSIAKEAPDTAVLLRSYPSLRDSGLKPRIWEAARATSAASSFFDPIQIGKFGQWFTDGATGFNNPVNQVYDEACDIWADARTNIQCIVSIGTGEPRFKTFGDDLKGLASTLVALATETQHTANMFERHHPEITHLRFNVRQGLQGVGIQEYKEIPNIKSVTDRYLDTDGDANRMVVQFTNLLANKPEPGMSKDIQTPRYFPPTLRSYLETFWTYFNCQQGPSGLTALIPGHIFSSSEEQEVEAFENYEPPTPQRSHAGWMSLHDALCSSQPSCRILYHEHEIEWTNEFGGLVLAHVDIAEVWRLLSCGKSRSDMGRGSNTHGNWIVNEITISVAGGQEGKPIIRTTFRTPGLSRPRLIAVASSSFAQAMTGGPGLRPDGPLGSRFVSKMLGYESVQMPKMVFFVDIQISKRVYFRSHFAAMVNLATNFIEVAHELWDHEDSIDCNLQGVPIKVMVEELKEFFGDIWWDRPIPSFHGSFYILRSASDIYFGQLPDEDTFEMEDLMILMGELEQVILEPSHKPQHVASWTAFFGDQKARWLVIVLFLNCLDNLADSVVLSDAFEPLLDSPTRKCLLG